jgi:hypothetical protein
VPVDPHSTRCQAGQREAFTCYLEVRSMAFRSWNRGLATTVPTSPRESENPYRVWFFNGTGWTPNVSFPGQALCPGTTIVWAGKLDYWLIGGRFIGSPPEEEADHLCRFDGSRLEWEEHTIPPAALAHVKGHEYTARITSGSCFAWNDCWFFGTEGTVLHWHEAEHGLELSDASPEPSLGWLQGEYTSAVAGLGPGGEPVGLAAASATSDFEQATPEPLPPQPGGALSPQLFASSGGPFSTLAFDPPVSEQSGARFRSDAVAIGLGAAGEGWLAANPQGWRARVSQAGKTFAASSPLPAPIEPLPGGGLPPTCEGPPTGRFLFTSQKSEKDSFLWSSIGVFPDGTEALAGGQLAPANTLGEHEPVIGSADCEGMTTVTRFTAGEEAADPNGAVTALAVNAHNDAWAATTVGSPTSGLKRPPHLYRLSDGSPPAAPEGDDLEARPLDEQLDTVTYVLEPPPELPPTPAPPPVTQNHNVKLRPALYDVKAKLHTSKQGGKMSYSLYLSFKLRRPVTVGAHALRKGRVVAVARPRHFTGRKGVLVLKLNRSKWPTKIGFIK